MFLLPSGASTKGGLFTPEILKLMGEYSERPVIFALSNPTDNAECTAEAAYDNTGGRAIFASGSPFPTYEKNGKLFKPGQGNNAYIFPGVALATIATGMHHISDDVFILAAQVLGNGTKKTADFQFPRNIISWEFNLLFQTLADTVSEEDLKVGRLYPPLHDILNVSLKIAEAITVEAYKNGWFIKLISHRRRLCFRLHFANLT